MKITILTKELRGQFKAYKNTAKATQLPYMLMFLAVLVCVNAQHLNTLIVFYLILLALASLCAKKIILPLKSTQLLRWHHI